MKTRNLPNSVVIIGAGPAGLFTARRLRELGVKEITLLEKENEVGGKCKTYTDQRIPSLVSEYCAGALVFNYGVVLDAINEKGVKIEALMPTQKNSIELINKINSLTYWGKVKFGFEFMYQFGKFIYAVKSYNYVRDHAQPLPKDLELPFTNYANKYGLEHINLFLKPVVPGFGYGAVDVCPTYSVLEYMGYLTIPTLIIGKKLHHDGMAGIQGGFQHLMKEVAKDFNIRTSVTINHIDRLATTDNVTIYFSQHGVKKTVQAEALVLAISPLQWSTLGMALTPTEQTCTDQSHLTYYRYPVAICHIKGLAPKNVYFPEALNKDHFQHVSLITTRDDRPDPKEGRLCTAYINLPPGKNHFSLEEESAGRRLLLQELQKMPGVIDVKILDVKIWEDYFSSLPWNLRINLEKQQYSSSEKTLYVGSYTLGSFEDVACVTNRAKKMLDGIFGIRTSYTQYFFKEVQRAGKFFQHTQQKPVGEEPENSGLVHTSMTI